MTIEETQEEIKSGCKLVGFKTNDVSIYYSNIKQKYILTIISDDFNCNIDSKGQGSLYIKKNMIFDSISDLSEYFEKLEKIERAIKGSLCLLKDCKE